ncbi:exported hypothetical protein [Mesorhizobium sp. ORS 3324]|nr:exported hypothetical protein [Mesorhizobium sp. ORS 3324]
MRDILGLAIVRSAGLIMSLLPALMVTVGPALNSLYPDASPRGSIYKSE